MRKYLATIAVGAMLAAISQPVAHAAPFTVNFTATIVANGGSYVGNLDPGFGLDGSVSLSTTEADAFSAITIPSTEPGHEFTSFYEFATPPFGWTGTATDPGPPPMVLGSFAADVAAIVVNDNLILTAAETGGIIADGTYDWIELLGSTTVDVCPPGSICPPDAFTPGDGEEWTLAIVGDSTWFSDGSVIPDALPGTFTPLLVGAEFDLDGNEIGFVLATVDTFSTDLPTLPATAIHAPATAGLVGFAVLFAAVRRRRRP